MVRSLLLVMCVGVLNSCIINTKLGDKDFACGKNDDCFTGYVCHDGVCITREEFFKLDGGTAGGFGTAGNIETGGGTGGDSGGSGGGNATAGGSGTAGGGSTAGGSGTAGGGSTAGGTGTAGGGSTAGGSGIAGGSGTAGGGRAGGGTAGGAAGGMAVDAGCDAGTGIEVCGDGVDNNCNQQVDCAELSCATLMCGMNGRVCTGMMCTCGGGGTPEAMELTCNDARDNDCDGQIDCSDSTCSGRTCGANGRTCSGTSCTCSGNGGAVQASESTCSDTFDNDCDGQIDCADSQCSGLSCGANGRTCSGTSCTCSGNGGTAQAAESLCSDTRDNDCDGQIDCADSQCSGLSCGANGRTCSGTSCTCSGNGGTAQVNESLCSDTRDNDCDGQIDCADTQCAGLSCGANGRTCSGTSCTCSGNGGMPQATETSCTDTFDNDCDGLIDAADPNCPAGGLDGGYNSGMSPQPFVDACTQTGFTRHMFMDNDDDVTPVLSLPFAFNFYGIPQTQYWITTNGFFGFGGSTNLAVTGDCLPSPLSPRPGIYLDFDDLLTPNGVCYAVTGAAPNRKLVITWPNVGTYNYSGSDFTFSVFLSETTNTIDFVYSTMTGSANARGVDAVVGMQNADGSRFNQLSCFQAGYLTTGLAIRFTPN